MLQSLDDFLAAHNWDLLKKVNEWIVVRSGNLVRFQVTARDGERYTVQFDCSGYPSEAPGVVFIDPEGSANNPKAWPKGNARFYEAVKLPPNSFICIPLTREGLNHHSDWLGNQAVKPWNPETNTLMDLMNYFDRLLKSQDYLGRELS